MYTDIIRRVSMNQASRAASQRRTGRSGFKRTLFDSIIPNSDEMQSPCLPMNRITFDSSCVVKAVDGEGRLMCRSKLVLS
jgi:hypothetical protein